MEKQEIIVVEEMKNLPPKVVSDLQEAFNPLFEKAKEWKTKAEGIKVVDINDKDGMKAAREARLELKNIRVEVEKRRKDLKEESLLKGKAIDGIANVVKFLIVPLENYLEEQEKFAEVQEEKRLADLEESRKSEMGKYVDDVSIYNFRVMSDAAYAGILENAKKLHEMKQAELKRAEEQRLADEKAAKDLQFKEDKVATLKSMVERWLPDFKLDYKGLIDTPMDKFDAEFKKASDQVTKMVDEIKAENEKLKQEAEKKKAAEEAERLKREAKEKKDREVQEARLKKERDAKEKAERALKAKQQEEERARKEALAKIKAAKLAPDKDKLKKLAADLLAIEYPEVKEEEAKKILANVKELMKKVNVYIVENVENI